MKRVTFKTRHGEMFVNHITSKFESTADVNQLFGGDDEPYEPKSYPEEVTTLVCPDCGSPMKLKEASGSVSGLFYGCEVYPACTGSHGARRDGRPVGIPGDSATRKARMALHTVFDRLWCYHDGKRPVMERGEAYEWLQAALKLPPRSGIGHLTLDQCREAHRLLRASYPHVLNYWEKLLDEDVLLRIVPNDNTLSGDVKRVAGPSVLLDGDPVDLRCTADVQHILLGDGKTFLVGLQFRVVHANRDVDRKGLGRYDENTPQSL